MKKITLTVGPSVILLALIVLAFFLVRGRNARHNTLRIQDTPSVVTRIRTLGELTTACFQDEFVITEAKTNPLSATPLGSIAREGFGKDLDDHLVFIVRGTVRCGIDFSRLRKEDLRLSGDTAFVKLPAPQYLDVILNPTDFEVFAESGRWTQEEVARLQDRARSRLLQEAAGSGLKKMARAGAEQAVSDLLRACSFKVILFSQENPFPSVPLNRPSEGR